MTIDAYTIIASVMRYVFIFIAVFVLLRLFTLSLREWRSNAKTRKKLRNAQIGYIRINAPKQFYGDTYLLYMETVIGRSRSCDISLPIKSLKGKHAIIFRRGENVFITACYPSKYEVIVNGNSIHRNDRRLDEGYVVQMSDLEFTIHMKDIDPMHLSDYIWEDRESQLDDYQD